LFTGSDTVFQQEDLSGIESFWFESERFVQNGSNFNIVSDASASNGKYITVQTGVQSLTAAPTESVNLITIPFTVTNDSIYNVFARVNCPTYDDDSYWVKVDNYSFTMYNGLRTSGWAWMKLVSNLLTKGDHTLTIGYREDGACLDKLCITNYEYAPTGMGETDSLALGVNSIKAIDGYALGQNYPNPFNPKTIINYQLPITSTVDLSIYNILGQKVAMLVNEKQNVGIYTAEWNAAGLSSGVYLYRLQAGNYSETKKLILLR
jgi:hypothetical protein